MRPHRTFAFARPTAAPFGCPSCAGAPWFCGDPDRAISRAYDVLRVLSPGDKRVTYLIGEKGKIAAVFHHEIQVTRHVSDVLRWLRQRPLPAETGLC